MALTRDRRPRPARRDYGQVCASCGVRRDQLAPKYVMIVSGNRCWCMPCWEAEHGPDEVLYPPLPPLLTRVP